MPPPPYSWYLVDTMGYLISTLFLKVAKNVFPKYHSEVCVYGALTFFSLIQVTVTNPQGFFIDESFVGVTFGLAYNRGKD